MELRTAKGWKNHFFLLRNGMLMYFSNEKSSDCDGLIDLDSCLISPAGERIFQISHSSKKAVLFVVNNPTDTRGEEEK